MQGWRLAVITNHQSRGSLHSKSASKKLFMWFLKACGLQGSWSHGCPLAIVILILAAEGYKGKESKRHATASSHWRGASLPPSGSWYSFPHTTPPELSTEQCHWGPLALTVWPLGSNRAVQTKAVTVLLGRYWLPVAWVCQSSERAEIPQAFKVLTAPEFQKDGVCPAAFLPAFVFRPSLTPSPSGPLPLIASSACLLP